MRNLGSDDHPLEYWLMRTIWSPEVWGAFKHEVRILHGDGLRGDALWKRIEQAITPLYASADPADHAQVYEDAMRYLVACGYLPASMAP